MLGKLLIGALIVGLGVAAIGPAVAPVITAPIYTVVDAYFGGAKPGDQDLPTIILLHAEGSTPTQALTTLEGKEVFANGWPMPVRVLVPMGRFGDQKARYYVDPAHNTPAEYSSHQRQEGDRIAAWLAANVVASKKVLVVGLGAAGPIAVEVALQRPELVRQAYATGGSLPSHWLLSAAPLQGQPSPEIRKLSYGDGISTDDAFQAAAKERGWDVTTLDLAEPPSEATVQKWLLPQLDDVLA